MRNINRQICINLTIATSIVLITMIYLLKDDIKKSAIFGPRTFSLRNILASDDEVLNNTKQKKIFFIESHTNRDRKLENPRQACSVESAALTNPDVDIYFIFVTNSDRIDMHYSDLIEALLSYPNVHLRFLNPIEFSKSTVLEEFFIQDKLKESSFILEHRSDVLRMMLINNYGGLYLDLDVLSFVPLSSIPATNFLCPEEINSLSNAIFSMDMETGRAVTGAVLKELSKVYHPTLLAENGPRLLTRVVMSFCNGTDLQINNSTQCGDYTVIPRDKCYPYSYGGWTFFYEEANRDGVLNKIKNDKSYFVHIWNNMQNLENKTYKLPFTSKSAYVELAKTQCPRVFHTLEKYF